MLLTVILRQDWTKLPAPQNLWEDNHEEFAYGGRWSRFLDGIEGALPNLEEFRFDYEKRFCNSLEHRDECEARMHPQRYISFDIDDGYWSEANDIGELKVYFLEDEMIRNLHKENLEADQKSLDRLLTAVKSRR